LRVMSTRVTRILWKCLCLYLMDGIATMDWMLRGRKLAAWGVLCIENICVNLLNTTRISTIMITLDIIVWIYEQFK
jgi:hypothetical protein